MRPSLLFFILFLSHSADVLAQAAVKGRVVFEGTPPTIEKVEVKSDIPTCGSMKEIHKILVTPDGGVANAAVKIVGAQGIPQVKEGSLDQIHCEFVPHVQILPVGSTLKLTSTDPVLHNAHGFYQDGSTAFNIAVPLPGMEVPLSLKRPGVVKLRCDAGHTWMSAYVVVTDTSFYALTDAFGNFAIEGVPAGNYRLEVWHEWAGEQSQPVFVKEGEREPVTVTLKGGT